MSIRFVARESEAGCELLTRYGIPQDADTIVLIEGGRALTHSDAALRICAHLRPPWRWLRPLRLIPRAVRDPIYRLIARYRYRVLGRLETCPVPSAKLRDRVIESAAELPERLAR